MPLINRKTLKNYFKKGGLPTENNFIDLIDSTINSIDDGIHITKQDGLKLYKSGISSKLLSFFKNPSQKSSDIDFNLDKNDIPGFSIDTPDRTIIKINNEGNIGINNPKPKYDLDINGELAYHSRTGLFKVGNVPGDGEWHTIIENLDGLNSFEINSNISGAKESGKYCISHAIAVSAFGGRRSKSKINDTTSYWGSRRNKIIYRWKGELHNYNLQIRTIGKYPVQINGVVDGFYNINYNISKLF